MSTSSPALAVHPHPSGPEVRRLALLALGVIYGDIGTSPLYALRECFFGEHRVASPHENILGVLSLVFWTLVFLVTIKYHVYVLRADNRGEGGILALTSLIAGKFGGMKPWCLLIPMGLFGAALLYGDGALTPAISVLSAVEGLNVATHVFDPYIVPITVAILIALFSIQRRGTTGVGSVFGPVMLVWFTTLGLLGLINIVHHPAVLAALNPMHLIHFMSHNGGAGFLVLGAVFLVATGGETLYADLGHFGEKPIQIDWFGLVGPTLVLNYFGQGALLLSDPSVTNPFYQMAPHWALYPLVILATIATVIASQAVITGVYSLTMQAVQLGYIPRVHIDHTSEKQMGQIYIGSVNWLLMIVTIGLVIGFGSSSNLAGAYGIAIATTMAITTTLAFPVAWKMWGWPLPIAAAVTLGFLAIDLVFFGANIVKIAQGGWFPLGAAAVIFLLMTTWKRGRDLLGERVRSQFLPIDRFVREVRENKPHRVEATAVYLASNPVGVPRALLHNFMHQRTVHRRVVMLTLITEPVPSVPDADALRHTDHGEGFHQVIAHHGFMQEPSVPRVLAGCQRFGLTFDPAATTFFLGRETLRITRRSGMARWRKSLFRVLSRNAEPVSSSFHIPANRVVEVGAQIEL